MINVEPIISRCWDFIKRNKSVITGVVVTGAYMIYRQKINIPAVNLNFMDIFGSNNKCGVILRLPNNSTETSIMSIYQSAQGMTSDYYRREACESISNIVIREKDISDDTLSYAMNAISGISQMMSGNYYKECATDLITNLTKKETKNDD